MDSATCQRIIDHAVFRFFIRIYCIQYAITLRRMAHIVFSRHCKNSDIYRRFCHFVACLDWIVDGVHRLH